MTTLNGNLNGNLDGKKLRIIVRHLFALGMVGTLFLGGCTLLPPADREPEAIGVFDRVLPLGWEALADWQTVNLDGDEEEENLLLFRFDGGQVGALILEGDVATSISPPDRLLPRYFDEQSFNEHSFNDQSEVGQGIIAAPGTPASAIALTQVEGSVPLRELVILGGGTHLTFAWWKGANSDNNFDSNLDNNLGYGVTQLYASGGFGVDWETWQENPAPITEVIGYDRLQDYRARSNICHLTQYTRRTDLPSDVPTILFRAEAQGLHFCNRVIPAHPFAPEGVVLAYLHWARPDAVGLGGLLTPGTTLPQLDAESAYERLPLEHVVDIAAHKSVPMNPAAATSALQQGDALAPTTAVCVEFAEKMHSTLRRWVIYTLRYQPADVAQGLSDRWTVSGAFTEPQPMDPPPPGYCAQILARNAP